MKLLVSPRWELNQVVSCNKTLFDAFQQQLLSISLVPPISAPHGSQKRTEN